MNFVRKITSRNDAIKNDLVKYYTATMCKNGHYDFRYTNTGICYACHRLNNKINVRSNPDKAKERNKKTYLRHRQERIANSRRWAEANVERVREIKIKSAAKNVDKNRIRSAKRIKEKRRSNNIFRLNRNISKEVWAVLRGKKQGKTWSIFVGSDIYSIKKHLEEQFTNGMNWDNYGSYWELDHIKPLNMFTGELEDIVRKAWDLSNLQPLEITLNRSKGARYKGNREVILKRSIKLCIKKY